MTEFEQGGNELIVEKKLLDFKLFNSNFTLIDHMASLSNKLLVHIFRHLASPLVIDILP